MKYAVNWDNGAEACGTFPQRFETEAAAQAFAEDWQVEMTGLIDADYEGDGYTAEVILVEEPEVDLEAAPDNPRPAWF
jgi:hypothetical protein